MFTEAEFYRITERLKPYDALYGQNGSWALADVVPAGEVAGIVGGLYEYEKALRDLPLLPDYVALQQQATIRVLQTVRNDPGLWRQTSDWPQLDVPFTEYSYVRPVTDDFHAAIVDRLPLLQRIADLQASCHGIPAARIETYRSETMACPPGEVMGYEDGRMAHPSGSMVFESFDAALGFIMHEGCHHLQHSYIERLERDDLQTGSWQFRQAKIFQDDWGNGRPVDARSYSPSKFGGNDDPYYAATMAYHQCPTERDAGYFGYCSQETIRAWQGLPHRSNYPIKPGPSGLPVWFSIDGTPLMGS